MKKAIYKVPNGKLLKIFLEDEGGKILTIKITGDFFMYPEEHIEKLEETLKNCELNKDRLLGKINEFTSRNQTVFFGLDAESLATTILAAA